MSASKTLVTACSLLLSLSALAQDDQPYGSDTTETETETTTTTEKVQMNVGMPGMPGMQVDMNVQVKHKTKTTTTGTTAEPARYAPAPAASGRDCGTGQDSGCEMLRNGRLPMDAEEFSAFMTALNTNDFELERRDIVKSTLADSYLTAKQLAKVLPLFENEITRFEVAQLAAPHVVNPKHALGLSAQWDNKIYATDFTKLMNAQK